MSIQTIRVLPSKNSSDNEWLLWFKDLKKSLGNDKAKRLFVMQWNAQDGYNSEANTINLRKEMEGNGLEIATNIIGDISSFGSEVKSYFGDFYTAGKWITIGLVTVTAVSVGGLIYQIAFKSKVRGEVVKIGTTIATKGLK